MNRDKEFGTTGKSKAEAELAISLAQSQPPPPARILVVDDDAETLQFCFDVLISSGYHVDTARDGEAGWAVLHAVSYDPDSYDLLITSNSLPKLSGVGLIKKLRAARMALPVIFASGAWPKEPEALQLAAILPTPFTPDELVQTVEEVLHAAVYLTEREANLRDAIMRRKDKSAKNYVRDKPEAPPASPLET